MFDGSFKRLAIDLSYARGSVKEVADEQREIRRLLKELKLAQLDPMLAHVCGAKKVISITIAATA